MKILIIADDEFFIKRLPDCQADVLISLGDLPDSVILAAAEKCQCREILAVRGNHDAEVPFPEGVRDLHLAVHEVAGVRFGGFCGSLRYKQGAFMFEQSEVERLMADFSPVDCFLAHSPPRAIHDREAGGTHIGFVGFSKTIFTRPHPHRPRISGRLHPHPWHIRPSLPDAAGRWLTRINPVGNPGHPSKQGESVHPGHGSNLGWEPGGMGLVRGWWKGHASPFYGSA